MIELLKNKRIDTALFCELATHPDFVKLFADMQIYVEGIASMQIQNLNVWVDVARLKSWKNTSRMSMIKPPIYSSLPIWMRKLFQ